MVWYHQQRPLQEGGRLQIKDKGSRSVLTLSSVRATDNGTYTCEANVGGKLRRRNTWLFVELIGEQMI